MNLCGIVRLASNWASLSVDVAATWERNSKKFRNHLQQNLTAVNELPVLSYLMKLLDAQGNQLQLKTD